MKTPSTPITEAFYAFTDEQKENYIKITDAKIANSGDPALKKMRNLVRRHLKKYQSDFYVHDVTLYYRAKGAPFLWILRDSGTHFINLRIRYVFG